MATISSANAQALMDGVAKCILDMVATEGNAASIVTGQGTLLGQIAALNDASQQFALLGGFEQAMGNVTNWITQEQLYTAVLDCLAPACAALEKATSGLAAFLAANGPLFCDPHYLDAHNRASNQRSSLVSLAAWQAFGQAIANMAQVNVTGAASGTFVPGTSQSASYGNAPLSIFNAAGVNSGASSTVVQVTYSKYSNAGVLQTGQTASATLPGASVPGAAVSLAVSGVAVTGITVTSGGNTGDQIGVKATLLRSVAY